MTNLTVVIPVRNESAQVVEKTYKDLMALGCKVIVVDDGNTMDLPEYINRITYPAPMGYGYAIKHGISHVDTELVCTMDGDGQHLASDVEKLYVLYQMLGNFKMVIGQRWDLKERPLRWIGRKVLNFIASLIAGHYLIDLNSGLRIFDTKLAKGYAPILCDTFSFTTSFTMSMVTDNHRVTWMPINVQPRAHGKSHVKVVKDGFVTLYFIVWVGLALRTRGIRRWLRSLTHTQLT